MISFKVDAGKLFGKLRAWLKGQIVGDVPPELGPCEFDCRKTECLFEEWATCQNRLSYVALQANSDDGTSESGDGMRPPDLIEADQKREEIVRESAERRAIANALAKPDARDRARPGQRRLASTKRRDRAPRA